MLTYQVNNIIYSCLLVIAFKINGRDLEQIKETELATTLKKPVNLSQFSLRRCVCYFPSDFNLSAVLAPCLLIKHLDSGLVRNIVKHPPATEPKIIKAIGYNIRK